jgi:sn-glycerol 3-phosphate transport system substrate-binding protein
MTRMKLGGAMLLGGAIALWAGAPANAEDRVKFDYWYGNTGAIGEVMAKRCAEFNAAQTKYEITCTGQGGYDKAEQNAIAAYRSSQQPTLVQLYDAGTLNFMLSDAIYPAKQMIADFKMKLNQDDYFPGIKAYFATSKGELWSFPNNHSTAVFYWNKDEWAKIGKTEPPKTWEEFEADAMAMKAKGVSCVFGFDFDTWQILEQFSAIHNIPVATKSNGYEGLDAELTFNKTKFVDHVKNYKKWLDAGVARIQSAETGKTYTQAFSDGSCASMISSIADHASVGATAKMQWGVTPIPVYAGTERKNSIVGGAQIWVMKGKSQPEYEAAAAFLDWSASAEQQKWMSTNTGYIPLMNTAFKAMSDEGFYKDPKFAGREVAIQSLTASEPTSISRGIRLGNYTAVRKELRSELEAVFTQNKDVQVALDDAVTRGNQILRRYEQTYQGRPLP